MCPNLQPGTPYKLQVLFPYWICYPLVFPEKKNNGTDSMFKCYLELRINFTIKDNKKTLGMPCF